MIRKLASLAALSLLADSAVHGRKIRGNGSNIVNHDQSLSGPSQEVILSDWDAVSNKTVSTMLLYSDKDEFEGTIKPEVDSSLRVKKFQSFVDKNTELVGVDVATAEEMDAVLDADSATFRNEEESGGDDRHGHRILASTQIKIKNNCRESADVLVVYRNSVGRYSGAWETVAPRSETQSAVGTTTDPEFFLYAESASHVWKGNSDFCFDANTCLKEIKLSGNPHQFTYTISCNGGGTTTTTRPPSQGGNGGSNNGNGGGQQSMTTRDRQWLDEHNSRRRTWHGDDYVPLAWSNALKNSARGYANKLIGRSGCQISHGYQGDSYGGENLAANWGGGGQRSPSNVLKRWVEDEAGLPFNQKLHFTQCIWKATEYLGCAEASKPYNGGECYIQVCRYIRPGNCNVDASNYQQKMLDRYSPCTPLKPSDA